MKDECDTVSDQDYIAKVQERLKSFKTPSMNKSVWSGVFEQIAGIAYALFMADRFGIWERDKDLKSDYHNNVRQLLPELILTYFRKSTVLHNLEVYLSGYYFNAGIQRIVWASERLLHTFAGIECQCSRPSELCNKKSRFGEVKNAARKRLQHVSNEHNKQLTNMETLLHQIAKQYNRNDPFDKTKALAMLRFDVNNRKHAFGTPFDRKPSNDSKGITWSNAGAKLQMEVACETFDLIGRVYSELVLWQPNK